MRQALELVFQGHILTIPNQPCYIQNRHHYYRSQVYWQHTGKHPLYSQRHPPDIKDSSHFHTYYSHHDLLMEPQNQHWQALNWRTDNTSGINLYSPTDKTYSFKRDGGKTVSFFLSPRRDITSQPSHPVQTFFCKILNFLLYEHAPPGIRQAVQGNFFFNMSNKCLFFAKKSHPYFWMVNIVMR